MKKPFSLLCTAALAASGAALLAAPAQALTWPAAVGVSALTENAEVPQVVVAPNGTATAVWRDTQGSTYTIRASTRPAGGLWSAPVAVSNNATSPNLPQAVVEPNGRVTAIWDRVGVSTTR